MKMLSQYTKEAVKTIRSYDKTKVKKWTYETATLDLPVQVGSLIKAVMQYKNLRFSYGKNKTELKEIISDELADIFTEVLYIAHELDIDIDQSFNKMLKSDKEEEIIKFVFFSFF